MWRARFSPDVEPAGPVHALISLQGDKTSVRIWAEGLPRRNSCAPAHPN
jgi:hypothetical protein